MVPDRATPADRNRRRSQRSLRRAHDHKDLGIHTELMTPSLVALIQSGAVTNSYKNLIGTRTSTLWRSATKPMYEFLNDNSSMGLYPVNYVNNPRSSDTMTT